jgi:NADH:ubiquinone oxidoreductase subunit E
MNETDPAVIRKIAQKWEARPDYLIEMLHDIQEEYNYLPQEALIALSEEVEVPLSRIFSIATFYKGFSLTPRGRFWIGVCMGTACHVQGADIILESFERELGIKVGEVDKSRDFSLDVVRCVGCCGLAPVVTVNQDIFGKFGPDQVPALIEKYRAIPKKKVDIAKKLKEIKEKSKKEAT